MHTIARSQTAIRLLDQAQHMMSELEDIKTSNDKWLDRLIKQCTRRIKRSLGTCILEEAHRHRSLDNLEA